MRDCLIAIAAGVLLTAPAVAGAPTGGKGTQTFNEQLGRSFIGQAFTPDPAARQAAIATYLAPDYIQHNPLIPPGAQGLKGYLANLYAGFPDAHADVQDVVATRDKVVVRYVVTGTLSQGAMIGFQAKGQKVHVEVVDIWTVKDGRLHEHWDMIDWATYLAQLGQTGLPAPFYQIAGVPKP